MASQCVSAMVDKNPSGITAFDIGWALPGLKAESIDDIRAAYAAIRSKVIYNMQAQISLYNDKLAAKLVAK